MISGIKSILYNSGKFRQLNDAKNNTVFCKVHGSLVSFITDYLFLNKNKKIIFISDDENKLSALRDDLELLTDSENIVYPFEKVNEGDDYMRTLKTLSENKEYIILLSPDDLAKEAIDKDKFKESLLDIFKNRDMPFEDFIERLKKYKFSRNDFVEQVGDFSVRGGIVDLFPEHSSTPLRIEFFGDTVESIREFDITTQRSIREIEKASIGFNLTTSSEDEKTVNENSGGTLRTYIPPDALLLMDEEDTAENFDELKNEKYFFSSFLKSVNTINFESNTQPDFHSNVKLLFPNLSGYIEKDYSVYILCSDEYQKKRINALIEDFSTEGFDKDIAKIKVDSESVQSGFIFPEGKLLVYTEHQIFNRYFRQIRKKKKKFRGLTFEDVKELKRGNYIVHRDFGIGIFSGLKKIKIGNNEQEVIKLSYSDGDKVFVSLNYVNLIKKYSGTEGYTPKLTRLGGGEWDKLKERTKKKVKDIARDLIVLYAKRKSETGFAFSEDTHWQRELEAGFMFEDTPDQITSTEDVKNDMKSETPMDRLICGDVGFGKTEIAVRGAFKSVLDNKQVAILVPTTILALQHYNTFRDRLSPFAVEVGLLTRMQTKKEQKETLEKLEEGKINIIIGTHRILSNDLKFKDLGLLIIDEEQRFGVKAKEKLKALKPNVDTLTLTATPIPRTLNFSLLGARDLSLINTPPKNRKPIITEITNLDWNYLKEVIQKEIQRKGQIYFVNDKIFNLGKISDKLKSLLPGLRIGTAHGQMDARELEDVIIDFIEKKIDVLLCTKIIESGLDISNVNTIIINNANMYGLAELYQLRGRVGRSEAQAYAYFISPPAGKLTKTAIRRLQAIEEYTDLGSGFNLAMRDMEIRGVGNLLGREQSGFVQQIGFEMYIDIIDEAVAELKENEFKDLFKDEKSLKKISDKVQAKSEETFTVIENDFNAYIPQEYIENDTERLNIYKRLYDLKKTDEIYTIKEELKDRFGEYLEDVENLFDVIEIKIIASGYGLEKISVHNRKAEFHFPAEKTNRIFESSFFKNLIEKISAEKSTKYNIANVKERLVIEINLSGDEDKERIKEIKSYL
ncbi:MAG TPA: transcription-repair coupling factor [Ignavibacteria bacterium]